MNFEFFKVGFIEFLKEKEKESDGKDKPIIDDSDVSIFMNAGFLKEYMETELNMDTASFSMDYDKALNSSSSKEAEEKESIDFGDILNGMLEDSVVINSMDTDGSGDLNEEEKALFFDTIKGMDGNDGDITFDDIVKTSDTVMKQTQEGQPQTPEADEVEQNKTKAESSSSASGSSSGSGYSGGGGSGYSGTSLNTTANTSNQKNLTGMTTEELNAELQSAQAEQGEKQQTLDDAVNGNTELLQNIEQAKADAYAEYQEELKALDTDLAKQVDDLKGKIDGKESEIAKKEGEISSQESTVSSNESSYNGAVSTRESIEASLASAQTAVSNSDDPNAAAAIAEQVDALQAQLETAKQNEEKALQEWNNSKSKLEDLRAEKTNLESGAGGLNELDAQMAELEETILSKEEDIKTSMDAYNTTKNDYRTEQSTQIQNARTELLASTTYINNINTAITNKENKENARQYNFSSGNIGQDIVDFAMSFLGFNEIDGSADIFLEKYNAENFPDSPYSSSNLAWCGIFVDYVLSNMASSDNVASWYADMTSKKKGWVDSVYHAAQRADAIVNTAQGEAPEPGDIVLYDNGNGGKGHIGLVVEVDAANNRVYTIEGNTTVNYGDSEGTSVVKKEVSLSGMTYARVASYQEQEQEQEEDRTLREV